MWSSGKKYTDAQKLKRIADKAEQKEKEEMEQNQSIVFARLESKFRGQQQNELQALLKRIEARRKEHIKQRNLDSKRLLQRNKNVQSVLEMKQNSESQRLITDIKKTMKTISTVQLLGGSGGAGGGSGSFGGSQTSPMG
jgi:glutamyl-tRNA reductase